jgi:hypothetical protein
MDIYDPIFIALYILLGVSMFAYIGSLTLGYFDQRKANNPKWWQRRNWVILITCLIGFPLVLAYGPFLNFGIEFGKGGYTITHILYAACYFIVSFQLVKMWKHGKDQGSIIFVQICNTLCMIFILNYIIS